MDTISFPIFPRNVIKKQTLFSVNDIQVIFNTDLKTAEKLEDDEVLKDYLRAVIQANLLAPHGILDTTQITSIERLDTCDSERDIVALDIATNVQQGVEELRCCVTQERLFSEIENSSPSDESLVWRQQEAELSSAPTLRWNSEMTTLLIQIRGDMDREFNRAKYKFRLWEKVAIKLNALLVNVKVTAKDCDDKWRNISATYRKNIDKMKSFGDNSVRWEYFTAMDNILKGTKDLSDPLSPNNNGEQMAKLINELNQQDLTKLDGDGVEVVDINTEHTSDEEMTSVDDELSQNCIITRKLCGEKRKWTKDMCLMLLYLRYQADLKFRNNYENTFHLWKELASQMNQKFLSDFNANELESVWNHCIITYEINLENLKSKGVNTIKWKYFAVMDELLGGTTEISEICVPRPGENLLKEFHQLHIKTEIFRPDILTEGDSLCFNNSSTDHLNLESDSEDNNFTSGTLWTKDMVKTLILLKKQINDEISNNRVSRKRQWFLIARKFRTLKNVKLSEEACEEKWRYLLRTYKKNLLRVRNRGTTIKWPFFWKMREIIGNSVLIEGDKRSSLYSDSNERINDSAKRSSYVTNDDYVEDMDVTDGRLHNQLENLTNLVNDVRQNQMKIFQEVLESQTRTIEEIHQEQTNIKSLLTQLLQKLT